MRQERIPIDRLLFDPKNPRLPEELHDDQRKIFRFLVDDIGIEDLVNAMAASGLIEGDPIIGRPAERAGFYYVVEGNRRLAALKVLNGERIADGQKEPDVPNLTREVAATLKEVTLQLEWDDERLEAYLGYKHVTAAREWAPEAKAKFVLARCRDDFSDENLSKFANRLGTKLPTLRRWLVAYLALTQAEDEGKFNPDDAYAKRYFGTFYTLLGSQTVQGFLGIQSGVVARNPVPQRHLEHLGEFVSWVIGTKKVPPIVNSRLQQELDAILTSPSALQYFRTKRNVEGALLYTEFNSGEIAAKLQSAAYTIEECLPKLYDVKEDPKVVSAIAALDKAFEKLRVNTAKVATRAGKKQKP